MKHRVRIAGSGREFIVAQGETVLTAALRQGLVLPYGCRSGSCGSCKARLVRGRVEHGPHDADALSADEAAAGMTLLCRAMPLEDLEIEVREVEAVAAIEVVTLPCRVIALEHLCHDVMRVMLRTPQTHVLSYLPGQYIDLLVEGGRRRSYSLASAPRADGLLELHVRHVPGGRFTDNLFGQLQEKSLLRFQGPFGTFVLRVESEAPAIMMAGGTGFAPIKALLEQELARATQRPLHLFWGVRARRDLYQDELVRGWVAEHPRLHYTPVLSEPAADDDWTGATGYVHEEVLRQYPDLAGFEVYAAGPPVMVESGRNAFARQGLAQENYFCDSFEYAKD